MSSPEAAGEGVDTVVFDLGGVLVDWDPRYLYGQLIDDRDEMEHFLATVTTQDWNEKHDEGRSFAEGIAELSARHPDKRELIHAYFERWPEMIRGQIDASVAILRRLKARGVPLYVLSNWSAETWVHAERRFAWLDCFDALVVSGFEGTRKPRPEIFHLLLERHGLRPGQAIFIDDVAANVEAARRVGLAAHRFAGADGLEAVLRGHGLL